MSEAPPTGPASAAAAEALAVAVFHSRFKIEWAKRHIDAVESVVKAIVADNPSVVAVENDPETGIATVRIGPKRFLPVELALHLGDAVHNLNSVIDFLWSGLARAVAPHVTSKITFPRHETRKQLESLLNSARGYEAAIQKAVPEARGFVLDVVKPYKGNDSPSLIWHLNKIDNINKHRLLVAAAHVIRFGHDLVFTGSDGGQITLAAQSAIQTQGHPLTLGLTAPVKLNHDPEALIDVIFAEADHFSGQPVLATLVSLVEAVSEVVGQFEKSFLPKDFDISGWIRPVNLV